MAIGQETEGISSIASSNHDSLDMKCTVVIVALGLIAIAPSRTLVSGASTTVEDNLSVKDEAKPVGITGGSLGEGRKLKGGVLKKMALPFLLLLGLKAGITIPVIFGAVALVAFKGMWSGLTALVVTAALTLRGLIPPSKIIQLPPSNPHHVHVADYIADYRRDDHLSRMDDTSYHPYNVPNLPQSYLPRNY